VRRLALLLLPPLLLLLLPLPLPLPPPLLLLLLPLLMPLCSKRQAGKGASHLVFLPDTCRELESRVPRRAQPW
jgi:hypothetical protein